MLLSLLVLYVNSLWRSNLKGRCGCDRMLIEFTSIYTITANYNSIDVLCSIHFCMIFVSELLQIGGFLQVLWLPLATSNNKTQCHEIIEILFKVELNSDNISTYIHFIMQIKRRKLHKYSLYYNKSSESNMICSFICYIYQSGTLFLIVNIQPINTNLFNKTYFTFLKFYFIYNMDRFQI
jgi:hypothetical protein